MAKLSFFNQCHKQLHQHMFTFNILELCLTTSRCKTYEKKKSWGQKPRSEIKFGYFLKFESLVLLDIAQH